MLYDLKAIQGRPHVCRRREGEEGVTCEELLHKGRLYQITFIHTLCSGSSSIMHHYDTYRPPGLWYSLSSHQIVYNRHIHTLYSYNNLNLRPVYRLISK